VKREKCHHGDKTFSCFENLPILRLQMVKIIFGVFLIFQDSRQWLLFAGEVDRFLIFGVKFV